MGVFPGHLWAVSESGSRGETGDAERILPDHGLPPKIRHSHFEWPATGEAARSAGTAARAELWARTAVHSDQRSEEHTSELQSHLNLVCRLLLEKKKKI